MGDLLRRVYNFYAPAIVVICLAVTGHWVWLLGAIGFLLVVISNNIEAYLRVTAQGFEEVLKRLDGANLTREI